VFTVEHSLLYSSVYYAAVFIVQPFLLYSGVYCTAVFIVQDYLYHQLVNRGLLVLMGLGDSWNWFYF